MLQPKRDLRYQPHDVGISKPVEGDGLITVTASDLEQPRSWIGMIFLFAATAWFAGIFWLMRPDLPHPDPPPTPIITMPDGKTYKVYLPSEILGEESETSWIEPIEAKTQYTYWEFLRRPIIKFLFLSMGPPAIGLFSALSWLGFSEFWIRRRYAIRDRN